MELVRNTRVEFNEVLHSYFMPECNRELMGVTTLMAKHGLSPDYSGIPDDVLDAAADRGTAIHELLEAYDNGEAVEMTDEVKSYKSAMKKAGLEVVASEYLISDNMMLASMVDKVLSDGSLADVKTTSTLHIDSVRWQLSIYKAMFEFQNPTIRVPHLYAIHIRNGKTKIAEVDPIDPAQIAELMECESLGLPFMPVKCEIDLPMSEIETLAAFNDLQERLEQMKAVKEAILNKIFNALGDSNQKSIEIQGYRYTRVEPTIRESIDSKILKSKYPEIAEECTKVSSVKGTVKITKIK